MPNVAVITQVKDESLFLPLWRRYYGGLFGYGNLFVIDDGSTDGSTANLAPSHVLQRPQRPFDEAERANEAAAFLEGLLKFYDWVIYTDVDEFLVLDPLLKVDFRSLLQRINARHINAFGINILHNIHAEADYDPSRPVFQQRRYGAFDRNYFKQLVHRQHARFVPGFHATNHPRYFAPGLFLMHLAPFDRENTRRRWLVRNKINWSANAIEKKHSYHFRMPVDAYLAERFDIAAERFAAATSSTHFLVRVKDFLQVLERERSGEDVGRTFKYQEAIPMVQLPERFRDTIPAPAAPLSAEEMAAQAPLLFNEPFDPDALYRAALVAVHGSS